jgi:hypothetical protein
MKKSFKEKVVLDTSNSANPKSNINEAKPNPKRHLHANLKHKILLVLTTLTIVAEVAAVILWITNRPVAGEPYARFSLAVDYRIAVINVAIFIALNILAFIWIARRNRVGAPFLIVISVLNRAISYFLFIGGAHGIFITWTAILVIFAYAEYQGLSNFEILFLSVGAIVDLALSSLLFSAVNSPTLGLVFYLVILAVLVGIVVTIRKLR